MNNGRIELRRLPFDDPFWEVEINVSNGSVTVVQDFYVGVEELCQSGRRFSNFTGKAGTEAHLELGDTSGNSTPYILLRAFSYDAVGHSAFEFKASNFARMPYGSEVRFCILCDVAGINRFGQQLCRWIDNSTNPLSWTVGSA